MCHHHHTHVEPPKKKKKNKRKNKQIYNGTHLTTIESGWKPIRKINYGRIEFELHKRINHPATRILFLGGNDRKTADRSRGTT